MSPAPSIIERAFQLARSGGCAKIDDIIRRLKKERFDFVDAHLSTSLRRDLRKIISEARAAKKA
jgi:hypothetical protein